MRILNTQTPAVHGDSNKASRTPPSVSPQEKSLMLESTSKIKDQLQKVGVDIEHFHFIARKTGTAAKPGPMVIDIHVKATDNSTEDKVLDLRAALSRAGVDPKSVGSTTQIQLPLRQKTVEAPSDEIRSISLKGQKYEIPGDILKNYKVSQIDGGLILSPKTESGRIVKIFNPTTNAPVTVESIKVKATVGGLEFEVKGTGYKSDSSTDYRPTYPSMNFSFEDKNFNLLSEKTFVLKSGH